LYHLASKTINKTISQQINVSISHQKEQKHLKTIIDSEEKHRRKCERDKYSFREKNGSITRDAYLKTATRNDRGYVLTVKTGN
jgi:hypothetical protein